jgi:hypothetical protein
MANKNTLWSRWLDNLKLKVVVNPLYYKITHIKSRPRGKWVARVTASKALLGQRIFRKSGALSLNTAHLDGKSARRAHEHKERNERREA